MEMVMNQRGDVIGAFMIIFVGAILGIVIVNVMPVLIDNFITPQIENRDFGSVSILMWNLMLLVYVAIVLISAFQALRTPPQQQGF